MKNKEVGKMETRQQYESKTQTQQGGKKMKEERSIEELAKELAEKQTWLRKGLAGFLNRIAKETEHIKDEDVMRVIIYQEDDDVYYLKAGEPEIFKIHSFRWGTRQFEYGDIAPIANEIKTLREIAKNLPKTIEEWKQKISDIISECEQCIEIVEKM